MPSPIPLLRTTLPALACAFALACESPGPPTKATSDQINQMNQDYGGASTGFGRAPDWSAMMTAIRSAKDSADRKHWISEFAHHTAALPESLRAQRVAELQQLMREGR
jgi:hypothetical protein